VGDKAIAALAAVVKGADPNLRTGALGVLTTLGKPAFEPLADALKAPDAATRAMILQTLARLKEPRAAGILIAALKDRDSRVRAEAAAALADVVAAAQRVEPLLAALRDEDAEVRLKAAKGLAQVRDPRSVGPFMNALRDPDARVRATVATELGELREPSTVKALRSIIADESPEVRQAAREALIKFGAAAVDVLTGELTSKSPDVRVRMAQALGGCGAGAVEPLIAALQDEDARVRAEAAASSEDRRRPERRGAFRRRERGRHGPAAEGVGGPDGAP